MKMQQGLVTVDTNLVVDQGTGWSVFPVSEKKLGLVGLHIPSPWSREAGLLWRVRVGIMTHCQV